jgi:hypothetical protein
MLTFEDCLALCELNEEEIAAIAEHENIPEIVALEFGKYLIHSDDGERHISRMILEDISTHRKRGDDEGVKRLELVLMHFVATHPKAREHGISNPAGDNE